MTTLRNQITTFTQRDEQTLDRILEHCKDLLQLYPHYGMQKGMIMQTLYNRVSQPIQFIINVVVSGNLMNKTEDEAYNLVEEMDINNYRWSSERENF